MINLDFFVMWSLRCRDKIINDKEKDMINKTCCNFCLSPFNHELYNQPQRQRFVHEPSKPFMIVFISQMFIIIFYLTAWVWEFCFQEQKSCVEKSITTVKIHYYKTRTWYALVVVWLWIFMSYTRSYRIKFESDHYIRGYCIPQLIN